MVAPLTPPDCDLRDFQFMPVDIVRLFSSEFHAAANDAEWRTGVTLWLKSFHQVPAASLPDDDVQLCRLAELGRDLRAWRKVKEGALHGWVLCEDGRYYHPVVAEKANEGWERKRFQRERSKKANEARWSRTVVHEAAPKGVQKDGADEPPSIAPSNQEGNGKDNVKHSQNDPSSILERSQGTGTGTGTGTKKGVEARGTRLPPDWLPSDIDRAYAGKQGFSPATIERIIEKFRNYWTAKSGQTATKLDWPATWRNWVLEEADRRGGAAAKAAQVEWQ